MNKTLFLSLLLTLSAQTAFAQIGGGAATTGSASVYGSESSPVEVERSKRQITSAEQKNDGTATFIEASILMNVKADEYIAVFGVMEEGKTSAEANAKMATTLAGFKAALKPLGVKDDEIFVDFVTQNKIYGYQLTDTVAKEELEGFERKKNVSIRFKDKTLIDPLVVVAAQSQIFDLIKVDYIVKDLAVIQARLQAQTAAIIKQKRERYQNALGIKLSPPNQLVVDKPGFYFPVEQYDSYTAAESQSLNTSYDRSRHTVQGARKSRTSYFNPLNGNGFDVVINPVVLEPVVQITTYMKVKCEPVKTDEMKPRNKKSL